MNDSEKIVKLNTNKEIVINIDSMQDLLNSITYATEKMEEAKANFQPVEHARIVESLKPITNDIESMKYVVDDSLYEVKKQMELMKPAADNDMINNFIFELEKFKDVDQSIKKIKAKTVIATIVSTMLSTAAVIEYFDLTKSVSSHLIKRDIQKNNYVIPRKSYTLSKQSNKEFKLIKKEIK